MTDRLYSSLLRRFQSVVWDGLIYTAVFLFALFLPTLVPLGQFGRLATFGLLIAFFLLYEALLVGLRGATIGQARYRIRVIDAISEQPIGPLRAFARALIKGTLGMVSLVFMLVTARAQSLHDLALRTIVVPANPLASGTLDLAGPPLPSDRLVPSRLRRTAIIVLYVILASVAVMMAGAFLISAECFDSNQCSATDQVVGNLITWAWVVLAGACLVFGWRGYLWGARARSARTGVG